MKKKSLKKISLNKNVVSNLKVGSVKGGMPSQQCSEIYYEDEDGMIICCTFVGC
ncbi:hypothetical protein H2O64_02140 [Kordia sp. YSTF-M3]|uniref:Natural product n=1 Tax=Kordia aestuariivivens TaxID=2759037 RepID=A0ABR7Q4L1_9FLAO|nr:hypothetical protein [Kordia aestuariivivens]MBC8753453.1 hypothetical protein [Kordia aestuariivivens]